MVESGAFLTYDPPYPAILWQSRPDRGSLTALTPVEECDPRYCYDHLCAPIFFLSSSPRCTIPSSTRLYILAISSTACLDMLLLLPSHFFLVGNTFSILLSLLFTVANSSLHFYLFSTVTGWTADDSFYCYYDLYLYLSSTHIPI
jgi:hypothetical protein